jgi:hypothetical protein
MFNKLLLITLVAVQISCNPASSSQVISSPATSANAGATVTATVDDDYAALTTTKNSLPTIADDCLTTAATSAKAGATVTVTVDDDYAAHTTTKNSLPTLADDCLTEGSSAKDADKSFKEDYEGSDADKDDKKAKVDTKVDDKKAKVDTKKAILSSATSDYVAMSVYAILIAMAL